MESKINVLMIVGEEVTFHWQHFMTLMYFAYISGN